MRVYIETYGCALNRGDSAIMATVLSERGHEITEDLSEAEVVIINTCAVRLETEERMKQRIRELRRTGKKLVVAGCLAGALPATVSALAPEASILGPQAVERIAEVVESPERQVILEGSKAVKVPRMFEGKIFIVPIADGCAGECSFCITKLARRKLRSYPMREIVDAVKEAVAKGAVEVELTAQDTAAYGLDLGGKVRLPDLVEKVAETEGNFMVRVGMMTPEQAMSIVDGLVEALKMEKVYKFVHLPVQSGSDKVLKLMNRKYTIDEYKQLVKELRSKVPGLSVATDIIVGHPGEDEEDFQQTLDLMKELRFERIHLAMYSIRPNTVSARLPQVPDSVKKERMKTAMSLYESIAYDIHSEYVGKTVEVLTTELGRKGSVIGRLRNYIPVVVKNESSLGNWVKVVIEGASFYDLRGYKLD
ncbi:MAG: tRNA (N(6)-L-threonylcarbamoyladenosine(37)-C(2))-methylthiotransferase [Sulfolobales archaeon]|nr:tRNA (N(6)-L-threonylcarbamoyladenosine(37)-C(2))-methylthiotransferase [Sulfolobales archaeon]MCG2893679.1 tRNA (N(6)-L-threonylcarbamoyladenosine(37)-C(2))-methylthiotransferase [Sulfolobales archaeon]MCG2911093.1 tRNA (N(6)-L-threonylcarbamoyladenosine(37)-C(2))-methylthiotransferase [Sulfolobales archaeon]